MLNLRFRHRSAIYLASTIFTWAPLAPNVCAQDSAVDTIPQVSPTQEDGLGDFSPETYQGRESDDTETRLIKELIRTLKEELDAIEGRVDQMDLSGGLYYHILQRLTKAQLDFHKEPDEQFVCLKRHVEVARKREAVVFEAVEFGGRSVADLYDSRAFRIHAELALQRFEKSRAKNLAIESNKQHDSDDAESRLMQELIDNLQAKFELMQQLVGGLESNEQLLDIITRLNHAKLEFHDNPDQQRDVLKERLQIARQNEASEKVLVESGARPRNSLSVSTAFRIQAELALLRFERSHAKNLEPDTNQQLEGDDAETRLRHELNSTLQSELEHVERQIENSDAPVDVLLDTYGRWIEAQLEFHHQPGELRKLLAQRLTTFQKIESSLKVQLDAGTITISDLHRAQSARIEAELALLRFEKTQQRPSSESVASNTHHQRPILNGYCECIATSRESYSFASNSNSRCPAYTRRWVPPLRAWFRRYR
jgi:hypothetical protein